MKSNNIFWQPFYVIHISAFEGMTILGVGSCTEQRLDSRLRGNDGGRAR